MDIKGGFPKVALYGGSRFSLPLSHKRFLMCLLATGLRGLNFFVLPLETTRGLLDCHGLFDKVLRSILLNDPGTIPLCRSLNHGPNLGECWDFALATVLLVVPASKIGQLKHTKWVDLKTVYLCGSKTDRISRSWKSRFSWGVRTVFGRLNQSDPAESLSFCVMVSTRLQRVTLKG